MKHDSMSTVLFQDTIQKSASRWLPELLFSYYPEGGILAQAQRPKPPSPTFCVLSTTLSESYGTTSILISKLSTLQKSYSYRTS